MDFIDFLLVQGAHFESFVGVFEATKRFFAFISRLFFLMLFGFESGCLGLKNQAFGKGGLAKIDFRSNWISHDSRVHFS